MRDQTLLVGDDHWEGLHLMVFWGCLLLGKATLSQKHAYQKTPQFRNREGFSGNDGKFGGTFQASQRLVKNRCEDFD